MEQLFFKNVTTEEINVDESFVNQLNPIIYQFSYIYYTSEYGKEGWEESVFFEVTVVDDGVIEYDILPAKTLDVTAEFIGSEVLPATGEVDFVVTNNSNTAVNIELYIGENSPLPEEPDNNLPIS